MKILKAALCGLMALLPARLLHAEPLRVGVSVPLTGPGAFMGADIRDGIALCSNPGKTAWIFDDHQGLPKNGLTGFTKMADQDGINFAITSYSSVASAVIPAARAKGIPLLLTLVSSANVAATAGSESLNFFSTGEQESGRMAEFLATRRGMRRVGVLYLAGEFGESYRDGFSRAFTRHKGASAYSESFSFGENEYKPQLLRLVQQSPEAIYVVGYDTQIPGMLRQAREIGFKGTLVSTWTVAAPSLRQDSPALYEGVICTTPSFYLDTNPELTKFQSDFRAKFKRGPSAYAGIGCDIAKLLATFNNGGPKEIIKEIRSAAGFEGVMGRLRVESDGVLHFPLFPAIIENGALRLLDER